jgi:hypothetical protein
MFSASVNTKNIPNFDHAAIRHTKQKNGLKVMSFSGQYLSASVQT